MENDPEIIHLSYREGGSDSKWLRINIVFRVIDDHDRITCDSYSSEYVKTTLWEVDDPEAISLHFMHTKMKWSAPDSSGLSKLEKWITDPAYDISRKKKVGWQINSDQFLVKIEKFNVYRYTDYVEDNSITRAALDALKQLKENYNISSRFVPFSTLIRSLRTLNTFWD